MQSRYSQLEKREQVALLLMSAFLGVVILYFAIWTPVYSYLDDSRIDYDRYSKLLSYLQSTESQAKAAAQGGAEPALTGQRMLTAVSRTAQNVGITPTRMQPEGNGGVSVWFDSVSFTQLMLWIERLESRQGIVVRQITIDRREVPGQVSVRVVLRT